MAQRGTPQEVLPTLASHMQGNFAVTEHEGETLVAWSEVERMPDANSPMGWSGNPLWSVIRVAKLDDSGVLSAPRTLAPPNGPRSAVPYWVDLGSSEVGLGWYEGNLAASTCLECSGSGINRFVVLAGDLQSAQSEVVSFAGGTDTGIAAFSAARFGDDILVLGTLSQVYSGDAASGALHCTQ